MVGEIKPRQLRLEGELPVRARMDLEGGHGLQDNGQVLQAVSTFSPRKARQELSEVRRSGRYARVFFIDRSTEGGGQCTVGVPSTVKVVGG